MNRYFYYIASLLCIGTVLTACSDEDISANNLEMSLESALEPSDYAISLDASTDAIEEANSSLTSKVAINSNQGAFSTDQLGVFMLAMDYINTPLAQYWSEPFGMDCTWYRSKEQTHDSAIDGYSYGFVAYLDNMPATARPKDSTKPSLGSSLELKNGAIERYPIGSFHRYNFYAYTPRVANIEYFRDSVVAVMTTLDGTQDVIYSSAIPGDSNNPVSNTLKDYAWSANYFRFAQNRTTDGTDTPLDRLTPKFRFTHKMSQLMFSIQPGGMDKEGNAVDESSKTEELDYEEALETELVGISITNVADTVKLLVAERSGVHNGNIVYSSANRHAEYFLKSYISKNVGSTTLYYADQIMPVQTMSTEKTETTNDKGKVVMVETPVVTKLGGPDDSHRQGIILPALTNEDRRTIAGSYVAKVVVRYPRNSTTSKYYTINVPLYSDPQNPDMQFKEGCSYEVKLRIYGPNTVKASSQERQWQEVSIDELRKSGNYDVPSKKD